jgi:5'-3' exoribonuclease 2
LTEKRNTNGDDWLFLGRKCDGFNLLKKLYEASDLEYDKEMPIEIKNLSGFMMLTDRNIPLGGSLASPVRGLEELTDNSVCTVQFRNPKFAESFIFPARKLPKAKPALRVLGADEGPVIGFQPHNQRQRASLDASGHRAVNFHTRDHQQGGNYGDRGGGGQRDRYQSGGQRAYGSYPPPNFQQRGGKCHSHSFVFHLPALVDNETHSSAYSPPVADVIAIAS